jgi:enamine deaminase RidA (YjgF/YER057c/UK114 family)
VKVTTYLTSRDQAEINGRVRRERLGEVRPALTVVIAETFAAEWLLEIEAIAAA